MKSLYKITALLLALIIAMSFLTGCSFTNQKEQTRTIVDITGAEVEIPAEKVWKAIGQRPLFGHHSGKKMNTFWACFMKLDGDTNG